MHQNAFTSGKNSTDLALVIDAMDLLYDGNVEAFALVTSDSDFTSLAHRLRESGKTVYVLGESKAPDVAAQRVRQVHRPRARRPDDARDDDTDRRGRRGRPDDDGSEPPPEINLQSALTRAVNAVSDDDGWALLPAARQPADPHPPVLRRAQLRRPGRAAEHPRHRPALPGDLRQRQRAAGAAQGPQAGRPQGARQVRHRQGAPTRRRPTRRRPTSEATAKAPPRGCAAEGHHHQARGEAGADQEGLTRHSSVTAGDRNPRRAAASDRHDLRPVPAPQASSPRSP